MPLNALNTRGIAAGLLLSGLLLGSGCDSRIGWMDHKEEAEPLMQRAALRANEGDVDSAIRLYHKVLRDDPAVARAHLDLGLLLHDFKKDYVGAIHGYRRYLELRPAAEKRSMIEGRIRQAEQQFAASILVPGKQFDRISDLQEENMRLRQEIDRLSRRAATVARADTPPVTRRGRARTETARRVTTYRVKRGDTLSSIADSVYGDVHRWKEIQVANADVLGNSEVVKVDQLLIIP